ncbi:MAG TPA: hypothetical protein VIC81_05770 [Acidimicrobiales bacterium]
MPEPFANLEGGESSCYAHLVCPDCQRVLDGSPHDANCRWRPDRDVVSGDEIPER